MEYWFGIDVNAIKSRLSGLSHPDEARRRTKWHAFVRDLDRLHWRSTMSPFGGVVQEGKVFREADLEWLQPDAAPDLSDPRAKRLLRSFALATARHALHSWQPRIAAILGIVVPDAKVLSGEQREVWDRILGTWVYPTTPAPSAVDFLENPDHHFGIADPATIQEIMRADQQTGTFQALVDHFGPTDPLGRELAKMCPFLSMCATENLWVCFSEART